MSHPSRGAWIEIVEDDILGDLTKEVAPLAGCVD